MDTPANKLDGLSPEQKRALLQQMLQQKQAAEANALRDIPVAPREGRLPLSTLQERMWLLNQRGEETVSNLFFGFRLRGPLQVPLLEAALGELVKRHEAFRTIFRRDGAEPVQVVRPPEPVRVPVIDVSVFEEGALDEALVLCEEEVRTAFDLEHGPLIRFRLFRLAPDEHLLAWVVHHISFDDWSYGIVCRELADIYAALQAGRYEPAPPLRVQYADFAHWHRGRLQSDALASQRDWWANALEGAPAALELPADRPRPAVASRGVALCPFEVPAALMRTLNTVAQTERATPFMVLLAAYAAVLSRYAGQQDVIIGSPVAGRVHPDVEGVVGFFANIQPLRVRLDGNPTFAELVGRVRELCLGAFARQEIPIEAMVARDAASERELKATDLVKVTFNMNRNAEPVRLGDVQLSPVHLDPSRTYVDLGLILAEESDGRCTGVFGFSTDLFDRETIDRLAGHYVALLENVCANPRERIGYASLLPTDERERVLVTLNPPPVIRPELCVHQLIQEQAVRTPDARAVSFGAQHYTYRELDARTDALATHLCELGVQPETRVAVCLRPSVDSVVAILGILKAGGAYVPLDPEAPLERLANILDQCAARTVVTESALIAQLPLGDREVFLLDGWDGQSAAEAPPPQRATPDNLAYILFTSGSTGEPKGVLIPHRALLNHNLAVTAEFGLRSTDRVLQFTPLHFDAAGEEIYPPLLAGASIVVRGELVPSAEFRNLIEEDGLTVLSLPPAYLHEWVGSLVRQGLQVPGCLRLVILGGEKLVPETLQLWHAAGGAAIPWYNVYGPTEATITAACSRLDALSSLERASLPIGRPVQNVRIHLLDSRLQLVPFGQPGEIFIGGAGLARGYVGKPDQTAERFIPDPFSTRAGERLYRTGDLGRYLEDGRLEFVGRADNQVKIRGFRVEPAEIEAALRKHPAIQEVVVVAREDPSGDKRLVAYLVTDSGARPPPAELRAFVQERLPDYMVPSAFVPLDVLPLTANGKIDTRALPAPPPPGASNAEEGQALPRDLLELQLTRIWEDALEIRPVAPDQDFFLLGGHSLLALRVLEEMRTVCGVEVPIATFFENPTIARLAEVMSGMPDGAAAGVLVPIQPTGEGRPVYLFHSLFGDLDIYVRLLSTAGLCSPVFGLRAPELTGADRLDTLTARATLYAAHIRSAQPEGPYRLIGYSVGGTYALETARVLRSAGAEVELLALFDARTRWDEDFARMEALTEGDDEDADLLRVADDFGCDMQALRALGPAERFEFVAEHERRTGRVRPTFTGDDLKRTLSAFRAGMNALRGYRAVPYSGRIEVFLSEESRAEPGDWLDWTAMAPGRVRVHEVAGTHSEMMQPPHVNSLATALKSVVGAAS